MSTSLVLISTISQHCLGGMLLSSNLLPVFLLIYWQHAPDCIPPEGTQNLLTVSKSFKAFKIVIFLGDIPTYSAVLCCASWSTTDCESNHNPDFKYA